MRHEYKPRRTGQTADHYNNKKTTRLKDGDATHRGLTDFYPEAKAKLKRLLRSKKPFDTGYFNCKHEIRSARIARFDGGQMLFNVTASMDDGPDLIDTLIWEASGGNNFADCGREAMDKAGFKTDESKEEFQESLLTELEEADLIFGENEETASRQIDGFDGVTFEQACEVLGTLEDEAEKGLERRYKNALELVKTRIENHSQQ